MLICQYIENTLSHSQVCEVISTQNQAISAKCEKEAAHNYGQMFQFIWIFDKLFHGCMHFDANWNALKTIDDSQQT